MIKKHLREKSIKSIERFSATLMIVAVCFIVLIPTVSAWEFDNARSYDPNTRTVTITNAFGLGRTIATIQLLTPLNLQVGAGYQKVAEFKLNSHDNSYSNGLSKMKFYDKSKSMSEISRTIDYKYKTTELIDVNDYETICEKGYNETVKGIIERCYENLTGTHKEEREVWKDLDTSVLSKGTYIIGIFTDVQVGDYVEWIPTYFGKEIKEWASWTASLNVDLISYYELEGTTGIVVDSLGTNDGQNIGATRGVDGKISKAFSFDGTDDYINTTYNINIGTADDFSWNVWINTTDSGDLDIIKADDGDFVGCELTAGNKAFCHARIGGVHTAVTSTTTLNDGNWHMITYVWDGDGIQSIWFDGLNEANATTSTSGAIGIDDFFIGAGNYLGGITRPIEAVIDEVGFWERVLTPTEVFYLYNGGDGITWTFDFVPNATLISPVNTTNYTTSPQSIDFTCYGNDDLNFTEMEFYLNGSLTQTNSSGLNNTDYIFTESLEDGSYNWSCTGNDNNSQQTESETWFFTIDSLYPQFDITYPTATNYTTAITTFNYTLIETNQEICWYSTNDTINVTIDCALNVTGLVADEGINIWTIYANDTTGRENSTSVTFYQDSIIPYIEIIYPTNVSYLTAPTIFNYTYVETNCNKVWFSNDTGLNNYSVQTCGTNFTDMVANEGLNNWTVFINDTFGNENSSIIYFTVDTVPFIQYESPTQINNYNSTTSYIPVNVSLTETYFQNITFTFSNGTSYTFIDDTRLINYSFVDGNYTYNVTTCTTTSQCNSTEDRNITVDTTVPSITIQTPIDSPGYIMVGQNETLNVTFIDSNLDICWYDYNGTNVTIDGCVSGVSNSTNFTLENDKNMTIWANDTLGNIKGLFYSWTYRVFGISETYSTTAIESSLQNFLINITYNSSKWNAITAKINYAGANYSGVQTGTGDAISFDKDIAVGSIPIEVNNSFYWIFSLTNTTTSYPVLSDSHNQTVSNITFGLCAITDHPYINFTIYSATNPFPLINATFKSTWDIFDVSGGAVVLNRSYEDLTGTNSSFAFCISPNNTNYTVSLTVETDATGYAQNYYYLNNATFTNVSTTNVTLYLLNDTLATLTELEVVDGSQSPIEDVYITIQYYDIGTDTFYTIGMAQTSYDGKDLVYLNWYDTFYKFIFVQDGTTTYSTSPYKISETPQIFTITGDTILVFNKFRDFEYSLVYNNETQNFVLTFVKPSGDVDAGCLRVIKRNLTNDYTICETCEVSSSATIYCNIADWGNGTFIADFYATGSFKWIANLIKTIGDTNSVIFNALGEIGGTGIAIIFAGIVTSFFLISPVLGVIGVLLGSFGATLLGFQPLDYATFWALTVLGGLIIWKLQK